MENINNLNIDKLNKAESENNVTIYISAVETDPESKENEHRIKLKNKIKEAKQNLLEKGLKEDETEKYLKPAYDVLNDSQMLRNLWGGLAIFLNNESFSNYNVVNNWKDFSYVGNEFYLAPVIEPIQYNMTFYILSINLSEVKLYKSDRFSIKEIIVDDFIPENMEEAIGFDFKDRLYQHVIAHTGGGQTFYHGHAEGEEEKKEEVKRFLQQVNDGLTRIIHNKTVPLVVASVDYIFSGFKETTNYEHLMEENISASPKGLKKAELHEAGWNIIYKNEIAKKINTDIDRYHESKLKSDMLEEVVLRAYQGRIDTLFVNKTETEWGKFDKDAFRVKVNQAKDPNDKELVNFAVINTYLTDGQVHFMNPEDMPGEQRKICAIYRY